MTITNNITCSRYSLRERERRKKDSVYLSVVLVNLLNLFFPPLSHSAPNLALSPLSKKRIKKKKNKEDKKLSFASRILFTSSLFPRGSHIHTHTLSLFLPFSTIISVPEKNLSSPPSNLNLNLKPRAVIYQ